VQLLLFPVPPPLIDAVNYDCDEYCHHDAHPNEPSSLLALLIYLTELVLLVLLILLLLLLELLKLSILELLVLELILARSAYIVIVSYLMFWREEVTDL